MLKRLSQLLMLMHGDVFPAKKGPPTASDAKAAPYARVDPVSGLVQSLCCGLERERSWGFGIASFLRVRSKVADTHRLQISGHTESEEMRPATHGELLQSTRLLTWLSQRCTDLSLHSV